MRLNKNGIRILDNPKAANAIVKVKCLPDQHVYRKTGRLLKNEGDWIMGEYDTFVDEVKCTICGETDCE